MEYLASHSIHDMMFKEMFSDPELTTALIDKIVPASIRQRMDTGSLRTRKDTFISNDQSALFADLLFDVKMKNNEQGKVYLLFEHKSFSERHVSLQLLTYMTEIWRSETNNKPKSFILPILISQRKKHWNRSTNFTKYVFDGFEAESLEMFDPFIPDFDYLLFDVQEREAIKLIRHSFLRITLEVFSLVHEDQPKQLEERLIDLLTMGAIHEISDSYAEQVIRLLRYLLEGNSQFTRESLNTIHEQVKTVQPEGGEIIMSLAEELKKEGRQMGKKEGRQEGRQEGQMQKTLQIFGKLMHRGESKETIMELLDIDENEFDRMKKELRN
ncbi:Rpn family recombination-promoting nuclease/putative transposase [Salisediminibacterium beveridgei]|uniref:Rpn family recombination-promoting nuclease/putative transposase n=1 Tax=Salisediminibacterium beveridgei TaxID=632773 RepID=UPI0018DBA5EE|nr:Rpn family recombination-promoting nuclease/putative transposase [Salisediminibacterium beveridgei]